VCKRIRGLEHDTIVLPAQSRHHSSQDIVIKVPPGHVWLEGDNCKNSTDSRYYGVSETRWTPTTLRTSPCHTLPLSTLPTPAQTPGVLYPLDGRSLTKLANLHTGKLNSTNQSNHPVLQPVPAALVKGRVVLKIWPLWEGGFVRSISPKLEEEEIAAREAKNEKTHAAWSSIRRNQNPAHARAKIVYRDEAGGGGGKSWEKAVAAEKAVAEAAAAVAAEEAAKGPAVVGGDASDEAAGVAGAVAGGGGGASTPQEAGLPQEDAYGKKRAAELFRKNGGAEQR